MTALRKESWLHLAKRLAPGSRRYVDHEDCGAGRTLVVSTTETGWSAHCFRCNQNGFEPYGDRCLSELQNVNYGLLQQKDNAFERGSCKLPDDFTKEIPDEAALWLYKAGIFKSTARDYGFGWSRGTQRVILPIYEGTNGAQTLVYMQARSIDGRKPKYLNNTALSKGSVLFKSTGTLTLPLATVVITEDILSSVRVGALPVPAVSTLGTSLSDEQAFWIASNYKQAFFWYDGDTAGIKGSLAGAAKLKMVGVNTRCIRTTLDPKCYSNREMLSILKEHIL